MTETMTEEETFDPTRRRLCADGSCVGVLGDDGHCRVCGRTEAEASRGEAIAVVETGAGEVDVEPAQQSVAGEGFDTKRRLCDDGSCVGVVGDDGLCRVCGRRAE